MATARLQSVYIGEVNGIGIYRVDLSQSGLAYVRSITVQDDNILSGGGGSYSGFDLDFVRLLNFATNDPMSVTSLSGEAVFDFSSSGVTFKAGFQTPLKPWEPPEMNTNLLGTTAGNVYDPALSTLDIADDQELSLGEGGQVSFLLNAPVLASGRYLYYGDTGGNNEGATILVSDAETTEPTDFTIIGTRFADTIELGVGLNEHLQFVNTTVYGRRGNDDLRGAAGHDKLYGEAGKDSLYGKWGDDWLFGGRGADKLYGGAGDDRLNGKMGKDVLIGGGGDDAFVFDTKLGPYNVDKIKKFNRKDDDFWLDNKIFKKLGKQGSLDDPQKIKKGFFTVGTEAKDKNDFIVYDKQQGILYYDKDGNGDAEAVAFATVKKGLKLKFHDFFVI